MRAEWNSEAESTQQTNLLYTIAIALLKCEMLLRHKPLPCRAKSLFLSWCLLYITNFTSLNIFEERSKKCVWGYNTCACSASRLQPIYQKTFKFLWQVQLKYSSACVRTDKNKEAGVVWCKPTSRQDSKSTRITRWKSSSLSNNKFCAAVHIHQIKYRSEIDFAPAYSLFFGQCKVRIIFYFNENAMRRAVISFICKSIISPSEQYWYNH